MSGNTTHQLTYSCLFKIIKSKRTSEQWSVNYKRWESVTSQMSVKVTSDFSWSGTTLWARAKEPKETTMSTLIPWERYSRDSVQLARDSKFTAIAFSCIFGRSGLQAKSARFSSVHVLTFMTNPYDCLSILLCKINSFILNHEYRCTVFPRKLRFRRRWQPLLWWDRAWFQSKTREFHQLCRGLLRSQKNHHLE